MKIALLIAATGGILIAWAWATLEIAALACRAV